MTCPTAHVISAADPALLLLDLLLFLAVVDICLHVKDIIGVLSLTTCNALVYGYGI